MNRALAEVSKVEMGGENDGEHRFKPCDAEAGWLKQGGQLDDRTRVMVSVLIQDSRFFIRHMHSYTSITRSEMC